MQQSRAQLNDKMRKLGCTCSDHVRHYAFHAVTEEAFGLGKSRSARNSDMRPRQNPTHIEFHEIRNSSPGLQ